MSDEGLIVGGWVLVEPTPTPRTLGKSLPPTILTTSQCIMVDLPRPEFWDWYQGRAEAEAAGRAFPAARVVTIAMNPIDAAAFMAAHTSEPAPYFEVLAVRRPLPRAANVLGYEVVGAEWNLTFHSWHCHGYADDAAATLGIRVNNLGLLATREAAHQVLTWMLELPSDEAPAPVDWTVIAVAEEERV